MQLIDQIAYAFFNLGLCLLIWVTVEQLRLMSETIDWRPTKPAVTRPGRKKGMVP